MINPLLPLDYLLLLAVPLLLGAGWLSWKGTVECAPRRRVLLLALRIAAMICLLVIALNPGRLRGLADTVEFDWVVLMDRSASMQTADMPGGVTRWEAAVRLLRQWESGTLSRFRTVIHPFSTDLENRLEHAAALTDIIPDGGGTDIIKTGRNLLARYDGRNTGLAGIMLLSDGRQVSAADVIEFAGPARAQAVPVYPVTFGGEVPQADLALRVAPRHFTGFAGQQMRIPATVHNSGMGPVQAELQLRNASGELVASLSFPLDNGQSDTKTFNIPVPDGGYHSYEVTLSSPVAERRLDNNREIIGVSSLTQPIEVLLLEGVPHWESKFLTQLLRRQPHVRVTAINRLRAERFFLVAETADGTRQTGTAFPESDADLARYDVVIFGKGVEFFLDEAAVERLARYLRDRGGVMILARGRPYFDPPADFPLLEPVVWQSVLRDSIRWKPVARLINHPVFAGLSMMSDSFEWEKLPPLTQAYSIERLRPFSEMLIEAEPQAGENVPAVIYRRFGQGLSVAVNSAGFWRWDFIPDEQAPEAAYDRFWLELIQWSITQSGFLPGRQLTMQLTPSESMPGGLVRVALRSRGVAREAALPQLAITDSTGHRREIGVQRMQNADNAWAAVFTAAEPGTYVVTATAADGSDSVTGNLNVRPPPREDDELSANVLFMEMLAQQTGGRIISAADIAELPPESGDSAAFIPDESGTWEPLWDRWWFFILPAALLSAEWILRRREGLL